MALVRVYCGLASADSASGPAPAGAMLTSAVVDDAGRLLHVGGIGDDPTGYARLVALLVERSGGPSGAAIAADSDDHTVTSLLSAAGRPLAIADDDSVDDFAERFADDESLEEMQAAPVQRRAVGLARALQAGALSAVTVPVARDLVGFKQVLSAHAALASGRHAAAVALREVLRELYPAALRAYPDPAEPIALAVLDALPEPGLLVAGPAERETAVVADAIVAQLTSDGVADAKTIDDAVTALRIAISETPRRAAVSRTLTSAAAETVRHAVSAVRACDAGCEALVATLSARVTTPALTPAPGRRAPVRPPEVELPAVPSTVPRPQPVSGSGREPVPVAPRRHHPEPVGGTRLPTAPPPVVAPPVAPLPATPPPAAPTPLPAAANAPLPKAPEAVSGPDGRVVPVGPQAAPAPTPRGGGAPQQRNIPPAEAGEPFRATLTTAAINSARAERQRPTPIVPRPKISREAATGAEVGATDLSMPLPPREEPEAAPPGARANWPLVNPGDERDDMARTVARDDQRGAGEDPAGSDNRVMPPWQANDLPQEPPMLRLVEPPPLADRALQHPTAGLDTSSLRQNTSSLPQIQPVEPESRSAGNGRSGDRPGPTGAPAGAEQWQPPMQAEEDGDLLIFAATRSAWFTGHSDDDANWSSIADPGWEAAEQAARPAVGAETVSGLPKRVPQANLVPGSPLREERPLRIVRNAARLAENTTGYFRGWRRGQEIGGFAVGGRPGREAAGGWDFSRDPDERDDDREYEYRSAGYRS